jgi:long-chain acyl-CoA synthetase
LNIHPEDLEAVLRRQPGVRDALVVAYLSPSGPAPVAVVIPDATEETLAKTVDDTNQELAPFQQIRYWLRWPQPEFPRTSTGKVLRRKVQTWAEQSLTTGGATTQDPSDPLLEVLQQLGAQDAKANDRLIEDLHLDSLAMVQLQSILETRFGLELDDVVWAEVRTVGDLRRLLDRNEVRNEEGNEAEAVGPSENLPSTLPEIAPPVSVVRQPAQKIVLPRWPWRPFFRWIRIGFLEVIARPLVGLVLAPRIAPRIALARPSLLIANHLTAFDVPVILYALSSNDRDHVAVAMSGQLLTAWRRGKAEKHRVVAILTPLAYWLVTALFNVFPLPRGAGLRQSFAHAGEAMDQGFHVLVFPEGGRSHDGRLQPFEAGIGLLAQESQVPVQPIVIEGLKPLGKKWPARGSVSVRLGMPLTMEPGEEPQSFTKRLETAVAALQQRGMETIRKQ